MHHLVQKAGSTYKNITTALCLCIRCTLGVFEGIWLVLSLQEPYSFQCIGNRLQYMHAFKQVKISSFFFLCLVTVLRRSQMGWFLIALPLTLSFYCWKIGAKHDCSALEGCCLFCSRVNGCKCFRAMESHAQSTLSPFTWEEGETSEGFDDMSLVQQEISGTAWN